MSGQRLLDVFSCGAWALLSLLLAVDAAHAFGRDPLLWLTLPPVVLAAFIGADFVSGLVHFLADTYCTPETPILGPKLIAPFREHHDDPLAITRHDFWEANGDNCFTTLFVLGPSWALLTPERGGLHAVAGAFVVIFDFMVLMTSVAHGWAHHPEPPRFARALQRWHVLISPEHHSAHHAAPHRIRFCITTGWLNAPLDRLRFFLRLEAALAFFGILSAREQTRRRPRELGSRLQTRPPTE